MIIMMMMNERSDEPFYFFFWVEGLVWVQHTSLNGKAAYNIKGDTIHTIISQLVWGKFIFTDEISMVGNTMFNVEINNRLKDIKGSSLPFRGVSIIAIGDLFQLQPVTDGRMVMY